MQERYGMPVWAPTEEEMRAIEARVRAERAKAVMRNDVKPKSKISQFSFQREAEVTPRFQPSYSQR